MKRVCGGAKSYVARVCCARRLVGLGFCLLLLAPFAGGWGVAAEPVAAAAVIDPRVPPSAEELLFYLDRSGLLADSGLTAEDVREMWRAIDVNARYLRPRASAPRVYDAHTPSVPMHLTAEFAPAAAVLLAWPVERAPDWVTSADLALAITQAGAQVYILLPDAAWQRAVEFYLARFGALDLDALRFLYVASDTLWVRDYAPFTVQTSREVLFVGGETASYRALGRPHDAQVAEDLSRYFGRSLHRLPFLLEGGNLITDGLGTCLMLDSVLSRNPNLGLTQLEHLLDGYLGCSRLLLFPQLEGDSTGHIDMLAMFVDANTLLVTRSAPEHKWYAALEALAVQLSQTPAADGQNYRVERVPLASEAAGEGVFWSYTNSLLLNDSVVLPIFGVASADVEARTTFRRLFPQHRLITVRFDALPVGAAHCATMHVVPATSLRAVEVCRALDKWVCCCR